MNYLQNTKIVTGIVLLTIIIISVLLLTKPIGYTSDTIIILENPTEMAIHFENNLLYVATTSGKVIIVNGTTNEISSKLRVSNSPISNVVINQENNKIYATDSINEKLIIIDEEFVRDKIDMEGFSPMDIALNSKTEKLYVQTTEYFDRFYNWPSSKHILQIIDENTYEILNSIEIKDSFNIFVNEKTNLVYVIDTTREYTQYSNGTIIENRDVVHVIDGITDEIIEKIKFGTFISQLFFDTETDIIYGIALDENLVYVIDGSDYQILEKIPTSELSRWGDAPYEPKFSTGLESEKLYMISTYLDSNTSFFRQPGAVNIIDKNNYEVTDSIQVGSGPQSIVISPLTNLAYVTNNDYSSISVIDLTTNEILPTFASFRFELSIIVTSGIMGFLLILLTRNLHPDKVKLLKMGLIATFCIFFLTNFNFIIDYDLYKNYEIPILLVVPLSLSTVFILFLIIKYEKIKNGVSQFYQLPKNLLKLMANKELDFLSDLVLFLILGFIINFLTMYMIETVSTEILLSLIPGIEVFTEYLSNEELPNNSQFLTPYMYMIPIIGPLILVILRQIRKQEKYYRKNKFLGTRALVFYLYAVLIIFVTNEYALFEAITESEVIDVYRPLHQRIPLKLTIEIGLWYTGIIYIIEKFVIRFFWNNEEIKFKGIKQTKIDKF